MKALKDICSVNTSNSLHSLLEASVLDIEGSMAEGDKYLDVDLKKLISAKTEKEYNILFDILRDKVTSEEKEPPTKTRYKKKHITSPDNEFYIAFSIYKSTYSDNERHIVFGAKDTVSVSWNIFLNKVFVSNAYSKFSELDLNDYDDYRYMPEKWKTQALKIILKH